LAKIFNDVIDAILSKRIFKRILTIYLLLILMMFFVSAIFIPVVNSAELLDTKGTTGVETVKTDPIVETVKEEPVVAEPVVAEPVVAEPVVVEETVVEVVSTTPKDDSSVTTDSSSTSEIVKIDNTTIDESIIKDTDVYDNKNDTVLENDKIVSSEIVNESSDEKNDETSLIIEIVSTSEEELGEIIEGEKIEVEPENKQESSIQSVTFTPSSNQKDVKLTVSSYNGKPEEVEDIPEISPETHEVYKYVDVKLTSNNTYIGETGVESLTFTFTVDKSWIDENQIDKETVVMLRYHDEEWQSLNTTLIAENDTTIVYEAETPGLSTFAVVGNRVVESSVSVVNEAPQIPWIIIIGIIASTTTVLIIVLFKARYIYIDEENKNTDNTDTEKV